MADLNSITRAGRTYLLVEGTSVVHLAPEAARGRPALSRADLDPRAPLWVETVRQYDPRALLDRRWRESTLCGQPWSVMAAGVGGPVQAWQTEIARAPSCRTCRKLLEREKPERVATR